MNGNKSLDTPHGIVVVYPHGSEFEIFSDLKENKNCFLFLHRLMNPVVPTFEIGNSFVLLKEFNIDECFEKKISLDGLDATLFDPYPYIGLKSQVCQLFELTKTNCISTLFEEKRFKKCAGQLSKEEGDVSPGWYVNCFRDYFQEIRKSIVEKSFKYIGQTDVSRHNFDFLTRETVDRAAKNGKFIATEVIDLVSLG